MRLGAFDRRDVHRRRKKIHHPIEQGLNAFVLECGAAQHGNEVECACALADAGFELIGVGM